MVKDNPPSLQGVWRVFRAILIQVWFAWHPFSPPHIRGSDFMWPQRGCTHLDERQGNTYTSGDVLRTLQSLLLLALLLSWNIFLPWTVSQGRTLELTSLTRETHLPFFSCDRHQRKVTSAGLGCSKIDVDSRKANPWSKNRWVQSMIFKARTRTRKVDCREIPAGADPGLIWPSSQNKVSCEVRPAHSEL